MKKLGVILLLLVAGGWNLWAAAGGHGEAAVASPPFPRPLESYTDQALTSVGAILQQRVQDDPFNFYATLIFFLAVLHTFVAGYFRRWAQELHHQEQVSLGRAGFDAQGRERDWLRFKGTLFHFLGEVEVVFGIWVIPLALAIIWQKSYATAVHYIAHTVQFAEPMFVVVIMVIASSRPVLRFAELCMAQLAALGKGTPSAWWLAILTVGPVLGSFITEPGAMTISALLLSRRFFDLNPSMKLRYATLGLLFVNVSVGGTFTHFAAPPVLMVAGRWNWDTTFMFTHFGWKALAGIAISNLVYYFYFKNEFTRLNKAWAKDRDLTAAAIHRAAERYSPWWLTLVHLLFMAWTVMNVHNPVLFIGGLLFFLAFLEATSHHQQEVPLRGPLLVGFFLAGLVVHGGCQAWWIGPVLRRLSEWPLMIGATVLTSFNDNAAITYLASLVPGFAPELKYAVMAGAVTGGGLTVIANAPNPAGQSLLGSYFEAGVAPAKLMLGALVPTIIVGAAYMLMR